MVKDNLLLKITRLYLQWIWIQKCKQEEIYPLSFFSRRKVLPTILLNGQNDFPMIMYDLVRMKIEYFGSKLMIKKL